MVPCKRLIKLYRLPLFARIWYMCLPHMYSPGLILFKDLSRIWPILHCSPVNPGLAHSFCIKTTTSFWIKGLPNLHSIYPPPPPPRADPITQDSPLMSTSKCGASPQSTELFIILREFRNILQRKDLQNIASPTPNFSADVLKIVSRDVRNDTNCKKVVSQPPHSLAYALNVEGTESAWA